jgi:hypothetical protein
MRFRVRLSAFPAAEPAKTIAMLSEVGAADFAVQAVHFGLRFRHRVHIHIIQQALAVLNTGVAFKNGGLGSSRRPSALD